MACDNALAYNGHVNNNVAVAAAVVSGVVTLVTGREVNKVAGQRGGQGGKERGQASVGFTRLRARETEIARA